VITTDDVRRPGLTLEQSVRRFGWPSLRKNRGKTMFLLDNEPGAIRDAYTAGRPSLESRVIFTNSRPGRPDAAFIKRNEPRDANTAQIQELVRQGYFVRTRSDLPLSTVTTGDTSLLDAALRSGAQGISTDFPEVGMSARYGSDFVARIPGVGPARCNPVNARNNCKARTWSGASASVAEPHLVRIVEAPLGVCAAIADRARGPSASDLTDGPRATLTASATRLSACGWSSRTHR